MRLTSLKLSGFKSFVDPTYFQVPGQLVGVVGPNGCGKSNIIDAVRWVLGESKASELRGESMQDVIFNGSTHRKPAGRASVELLFDNAEHKAAGQWGQYSEIAVKRSLTRDGTSTYYINNQAVRRRDIQDIFLGTGLGPRAYAIIGQGMIARIIEARPEELRIFLEEAAGVSKYKERRRETENRLHDTRENLLRIDDILRELNSNLQRLESQAAVAQRYHALQTEQTETQTLLWLLRKNEASVEQQKFFGAIEQAQLALEQKTAELRHLEAQLEQLRQHHYSAGDLVHQVQGQLYQTNAEIGSIEAQIRFVIDARQRLQSRLDGLRGQRDQWHSQSQQQQQQLVDAEADLEQHSLQALETQQRAEQQQDALPLLEQNWRTAQLQLSDTRAQINRLQQQLELETAQQRNTANQLIGLSQRRQRLQQEQQAQRLPEAAHLTNLSLQLAEKQATLTLAKQQLEQLQNQQPILEQQRKSMQAIGNAENAKHAQLEARFNALKQLQQRLQNEGKIQPWLRKHGLDALPRIWQKLLIAPGWETALEAVLRERISALEVTDLNLVEGFFADAPPAKLAFFSLQSNPGTALVGAAEQPAARSSNSQLKPLLGLLQFNDPALRALLQDWLSRVFIADDAASALALRAQLSDGALLVTRAGHLISNAAVRFYAPDSEQDGVLARQQEIDNLAKQTRAQQLLTEQARQDLAQADGALNQTLQRAQELRQQVGSLTQTAHSLQIEVVQQTEIQQRIAERNQQINHDLKEIAEQEEQQRLTQIESESRFEHLDSEIAQAQQQQHLTQQAYAQQEHALSEARLQLRELERAAQQAQFAEQTQRNRIAELTRNIQLAKDQAAQLFASMQQGALELDSLDDAAAQASLQTLLEQRSVQELQLANARSELDQLTQQLRSQDEARMRIEHSLQPQREQITELQLKEQAARLNLEQFAQQLSAAKVDESALALKLDGSQRPAQLQAELTRIGNALTALGAVNLAALNELGQASERKQFLDAQVADLNQAIDTLQDAIHKIDRETRELLQDTFDRVNQHFGELFPILFGGGNARLIMTGNEILDSGVQVMAQPPGKKNATIHLLSGGEKALTATALVFSMFQLNPAPFCLLDEVDAPLDDANTERFCKMVQRMSKQTQFLFISHNKIAMEMAQQLIGVTMQEQGVSRIVAVDLQSAGQFAADVMTQ